MNRRFVWMLAIVLLAGCDDQPADVYTLSIDSRAIELPVHKDGDLIRRDILAQVKPLWDGLESGESVWFYLERSVTDSPRALSAQRGNEVVATTTRSVTTVKYRFFRNREGESGIETSGWGLWEDLPPQSLVNGEGVKWEFIEHYLITQTLDNESLLFDLLID